MSTPVGVVLMVVGALGVLLSLVFWNSWGGFGSGARTGTGGGWWRKTSRKGTRSVPR
jgi:hypothetical protein